MIAWLEQADSLLLGPFWFAGCVLLGGGALVAWLARIPSWRVRISELAFLGMVAWLVLALVPMPRLGQSEVLGNEAVSIAVVNLERAVNPSALALAIEQANLAPMPPALPKPVAAPVEAALVWFTMGNVWLLAAAIAVAVLLVGVVLLKRLLVRSTKADESVQRLAQQVGARMGLKKPIDVRVHDKLRAPFCCKLRTVVLPQELLADCGALRAVLAHELAHIAAADPLRRTVFAMLTPLFALHPAWWVLRRMSTQASEEAADARAAMALGQVASQYARPLIELSARLGKNGVAPLHPSIVGVLGQPTSFTRRMTMLLTRDPAQAVRSLNRRQGILATASTLLALALSVGAWGTPASAQDRAQGVAASMERTIRPDFTDCSLRDALRTISRKSGLKIAIDTNVAARNIRIKRLALGEMPVRRLLDTLAVAHDLRWKKEKGRVVFRTAKAKTLPVDAATHTEQEYVRLVVESLSKAAEKSPQSQAPSETEQAIARGDYRQLRGMAVADSYTKKAHSMFQRGELVSALRECDRALQLRPDSADTLRLRAKIQRALGDETGARVSAARASRLDPESAFDEARSNYDKQKNKKESLRSRYIDAFTGYHSEELSESVEKVLPDALRKASKRSRQEKEDEADRAALKKAFPDFPAKYREMLLQYYRKLGRGMPNFVEGQSPDVYVMPPAKDMPKNVTWTYHYDDEGRIKSGDYDAKGRHQRVHVDESAKSAGEASKPKKTGAASQQGLKLDVPGSSKTPTMELSPGSRMSDFTVELEGDLFEIVKQINQKKPKKPTSGEPGWVKALKNRGR